MGNCSTCKFWEPFGVNKHPDWFTARRLGLCRKASMIDDQYDETSIALAQDGSNYTANLRTAAEFGCVMHELDKGETT